MAKELRAQPAQVLCYHTPACETLSAHEWKLLGFAKVPSFAELVDKYRIAVSKERDELHVRQRISREANEDVLRMHNALMLYHREQTPVRLECQLTGCHATPLAREGCRRFGCALDRPEHVNTAPDGYGYEFPPDAGGINGARRPTLPGEQWKVPKVAPPPARDPAVRRTNDPPDPYASPE